MTDSAIIGHDINDREFRKGDMVEILSGIYEGSEAIVASRTVEGIRVWPKNGCPDTVDEARLRLLSTPSGSEESKQEEILTQDRSIEY